jgi:type VI secretion system protein ImpA
LAGAFLLAKGTMRFDWLLEPISEAEPCGPDLDEIGDDDYLNYMLGADNRLPSRFIDSSTGLPIDRSALDVKSEVKSITGFLEQSRDLRLLTLEARFQVLTGQLIAFSECVQAVDALLAKYWDDVHPKGMDGDFTLRQNTVGALEDRGAIILPLQYAPFLRDPRAGAISLNDYLIAKGSATAVEGQQTIDANQIADALGSESHRAAIDQMHASLSACRRALVSISDRFDESTDYQFSPGFDLLTSTLGDILKAIESGRPDLNPSGATAVAEVGTADAAPGPAAGEDGATATVVVTRVKAGAVDVPNQAAAAAALLAAEQYFGRYEPSSPALLLIHQARMLVGKPLVTALESLLPDYAENAMLVIDSAVGFEFNMTKLRAIVEDYASVAEDYSAYEETPPAYSAQTRVEAMALLAGVSAFFRAYEPSSPVPMLLSRSERFANQSFQAILSDIMPRKTAE